MTDTRRIYPTTANAERLVDLAHVYPESIASYMRKEAEHVTLRGRPESTEGTVHARIGPIGWFEFTGV